MRRQSLHADSLIVWGFAHFVCCFRRLAEANRHCRNLPFLSLSRFSDPRDFRGEKGAFLRGEMAGGGIEPPTRGFSVHVSYEGKYLKNRACMTAARHAR